MNSLSVYSTAQCYDVLSVQRQTGALPVQGQQTLIGRLQEHVGEVLPQRQGRRVGEQTLAQNILSTGEITRQNQLGTEIVGEGGHGVDHLVDDGRGKSPREVARGVGGEGWTLCQVQGSTTEEEDGVPGSLRCLLEQALELGPVGGEVLQLITRSPRRRGQVSRTHGSSSVDHVVPHGWLLDVDTGVGEWPDGGLNLLQGEETISVHREVGHDGPHRITGWRHDRRDGEGTENVNAQGCLFFEDLPCSRHDGWRSRYWLLFDVIDQGTPCWCAAYHEDRHGTAPALASPPRQKDDAGEQTGQRRPKDIQQVGERRAGRSNHLLWRGHRHRQLPWERQGDARRPAYVQRHWCESGEAVVLHAECATRRNDKRAATIIDRYREVVGRIHEAVVSRAVGVVRLIDRVRPRHDVATARSRDVAKGRSGQWRHSREEVARQWIAVVALNRSRTHLQRQVDLSIWCVQVLIDGARRIEGGQSNEQHACQRGPVFGVRHGNLVVLRDGVDGALSNVTRASWRTPRQRHDKAEPQRERRVVES